MSRLTNVKRVLLTNVGAANTGTTIQTIVNGDMLILNRANAVLTGTPTATSADGNDQIRIAMGIGTGKAILSDRIKLSEIRKVTVRPYAAPTQQVVAIGFNGTSGTLSAPTNNTEYPLRINIKDADSMGNAHRAYSYITDSSATAYEVADALAKQVNRDASISDYISAGVITNGTFTALTNNAVVTNGSPNVSSTAHGLAAGARVRIGGSAATAPTYTVRSVTDANNFVLSSNYAGASATVTAANIGGITGTVTTPGIILTAKPIPYSTMEGFQMMRFSASLSNEFSTYSSGAESSSELTAGFPGSGTYELVTDMEFDASGYLGVQSRRNFYDAANNPSTRASATGTYNIVVIEHWLDSGVQDIQAKVQKPVSTVVCFDVSTSATKFQTFVDILESLAESAGYFVE